MSTPLVESLTSLQTSLRLDDKQVQDAEPVVGGDYEFPVTAFWVRLDITGAGIVIYNNKEYVTRVVGIASIPPGTPVQMTFVEGVYYTTF